MKLMETNIVGEMTVIKFNGSAAGPGAENKLRYFKDHFKDNKYFKRLK